MRAKSPWRSSTLSRPGARSTISWASIFLPLLWKKIRRGLSAGRVQSPALRMIAEREDEIERFEPREYWSVEADLSRTSKGPLFRGATHA